MPVCVKNSSHQGVAASALWPRKCKALAACDADVPPLRAWWLEQQPDQRRLHECLTAALWPAGSLSLPFVVHVCERMAERIPTGSLSTCGHG